MLDMIFPPSEDALMVRDATLSDLSLSTVHDEVKGIRTLLPFRNPLVRACIHEAKFHGNQKAQALLGGVCNGWLRGLPKEAYVLVPIPLSASRERERGYNQAAEIAKRAVSGIPHIVLDEKILARKRHTQPQTDLPKEKRKENVAGAFAVKNPALVAGKHIILIDDVATTGATMLAAKRVLEECGPASMTMLALAH